MYMSIDMQATGKPAALAPGCDFPGGCIKRKERQFAASNFDCTRKYFAIMI